MAFAQVDFPLQSINSLVAKRAINTARPDAAAVPALFVTFALATVFADKNRLFRRRQGLVANLLVEFQHPKHYIAPTQRTVPSAAGGNMLDDNMLTASCVAIAAAFVGTALTARSEFKHISADHFPLVLRSANIGRCPPLLPKEHKDIIPHLSA